MRAFLAGLAVLAVAALAGFIVLEMWNTDWRWRPHTIDKHQAMIAQALDQSGWVSPHLTGPKVYVVVYLGCPPCLSLQADALARLQAAGVDTRMVVIARADENGQAKSAPQDRALAAELWTNRSWRLYQLASAPPPDKPPAPGHEPPPLPAVAPADGDTARTAVVGVGRTLVSDLTPLLKDNGIGAGYPTLVWWDKDGAMRGCVCDNPKSWRFVEQELGA